MTTADQAVHFLDTGDIQIRLAGKPPPPPLVLPRPTFGQIKRLIRAEGRTADTLQAISTEAQAVRNAVMQAAEESGVIRDETIPALTEMRDKVRAAADKATDAAHDTLAAWWTDVFTELNDGAVPDQDAWPSIFMDPELPGRMIRHWRFQPTGPG